MEKGTHDHARVQDASLHSGREENARSPEGFLEGDQRRAHFYELQGEGGEPTKINLEGGSAHVMTEAVTAVREKGPMQDKLQKKKE